MTDSLFADVSYFQAPVDDSYPYGIFSCRSNDGTFRDQNFEHNYQWACKAADSGKLSCFIVYCYWRPNWADCVATMIDMVLAQGSIPHPKMIAMLDVESGGNPGGDQSDGINRAYWKLADWLGSPKRVIGYANTGDFNSMWRTRPDGLRVIGAGYGQNPQLPGQIAHQYTDGRYRDGDLPTGTAPFGNCFTGGERLVTRGGVVTFRDVAGTSQEVLGYRGEWAPARIESFGEQPIVNLTVARYGRTRVIRTTADHGWFLSGGRTRRSNRVCTTELKPGDKLQSTFRVNHLQRVRIDPVGVQAGVVFGDGYKTPQGSRVKLYGDKDILMKWFPLSPTRTGESENGVSWIEVNDLPCYFKDRPPLGESLGYLYGWLAGYFATDGTVNVNSGAQLCSADRGDIEHAQAVCHLLGVRTFGIRSEIRDTAKAADSELFRMSMRIDGLADEFFIRAHHRERAQAIRGRRGRGVADWQVVAVDLSDDTEQVFCAIVPNGHAFVLDGNILTSNCDMNSADGLSATDFAAACGINNGGAVAMTTEQQIQEIWDQLRGVGGNGWPQLGGRSLVNAVAVIGKAMGLSGFAPIEDQVSK